ncbi:hypothetical protein LEL_03965 [Akanthomyces lecanii RCEF 1005]|uniref:Uncharacterized protein n=1 Tax=Akanthomyces lecanii RCEF 1005 TaxID=1081108 RepID=A0A162K2V1_CORDF|nr:hypothetical protein LEL_03965 [Akanthomyces lecanii RCEF 1005]
MAKCYNLDGKEDSELKPCDPTAKISTCCRPTDFCLSNGLCLGGGGNNGYSQQGCTSQKWDSPCQSYCSDSIASFGDGFHYLQQCSGFDANARNLFCCGGDYGCCNNTDTIVTGIKKYTAISRAGAPTSTAASGTVTVTATATSPADDSNNSTKKTDNSKVVAVGAGVGASLGIALLATIGALVWQIRKQKKYTAVHAPAPQQHVYSGQPKYEPQQQHPAELAT